MKFLFSWNNAPVILNPQNSLPPSGMNGAFTFMQVEAIEDPAPRARKWRPMWVFRRKYAKGITLPTCFPSYFEGGIYVSASLPSNLSLRFSIPWCFRLYQPQLSLSEDWLNRYPVFGLLCFFAFYHLKTVINAFNKFKTWATTRILIAIVLCVLSTNLNISPDAQTPLLNPSYVRSYVTSKRTKSLNRRRRNLYAHNSSACERGSRKVGKD